MTLRMIQPSRRWWSAAVVAFALLVGVPVGVEAQSDHELARKAVAAGEMLPLKRIVERVEQDHPGQILEVELERKSGVWLYEIKLLRKSGALVKLKVDARDGKVLGIEDKRDRRR